LFEPLDVNIIVKELSKMLFETFPRTITIERKLDPHLPPVIGDATQIHQILLNLCVNARDAMPNGGTLTLSTEQMELERLSKQFPRATAPRYVVLTVSDTGVGMDEQTLSRIFEPFFTTKAPGHGTGLGLAVVHGVVGSHNGFVDVESRPGKGSIFRIYLPAAEKPLFDQESTMTATELPGGTETILIVEDEQDLRQVLESYLKTRGYTVISAEDGEQALELYRSHEKEIALVISDIGIPRLSGTELFRHIKEINPAAKVILTSGFVDPKVRTELLSSGLREIIIKPYTLADLLVKTRKVLDTDT
jgi:CheY-like chemotaxis protein